MHPWTGLRLSTSHRRPETSLRVHLLLCRVCFLVFALFFTSSASAEYRIDSLHPHIYKGGYALQIDGKVVRSFNLNTPFIPASTIKVLTGLIALEILGPQYRFATRFYLDAKNNLYIKGEGDPFLISENVSAIAEEIKKRGIEHINSLVLDDSEFALEGPPVGSVNSENPYDAYSGALAVNFNALPFRVLKNGSILSGEKQTPLLPMMKELGKNYVRGRHRINVSALANKKDYTNTLRYTGELFVALFTDHGIRIDNGFTVGTSPQDAKSIFVYQSDQTVADLVRSTLFYSNNFISNQLYLRSGSRVFGSPASWEKSAKTAKKFIDVRLQLPADTIQMVDGSGLSTRNNITPSAMLRILNKFEPYAELFKQRSEILVKSGTLTGVYCYVGYFKKNQRLAPYVLFLNQNRNTRKKLLKLMYRHYLSMDTGK